MQARQRRKQIIKTVTYVRTWIKRTENVNEKKKQSKNKINLD